MRDDGEPLTRRIVPEVSVSTKTSPGHGWLFLWLWTSSDSPSPTLFHSDLLRIDAVAGGRSPDGDGQRDARPPAALMQLRPLAGVVEMYLCPPTICPARLCSEQGPLVLACLAIQDLGEQNSFRDCGGRRLQASRARARAAPRHPPSGARPPPPSRSPRTTTVPPSFVPCLAAQSLSTLFRASLFSMSNAIQSFGKGALRVAKNYTKGYSDTQVRTASLARGSRKVRSARAISAEVPTNRFDQDASNWPPP
jgi:hypothetical protein